MEMLRRFISVAKEVGLDYRQSVVAQVLAEEHANTCLTEAAEGNWREAEWRAVEAAKLDADKWGDLFCVLRWVQEHGEEPLIGGHDGLSYP